MPGSRSRKTRPGRRRAARKATPRVSAGKQVTRRWQRRKEARPAEIVAAALEVFSERGFSAARLDDVAARAGVSKGTLYLYFDSKEELFKAVVRESLLPNLAQAEELAKSFPGSTPELLRKLLGTVGHVIAETNVGAIPKLVISESGNFPELARFYLREVIRRAFRLLGGILKRGMARGEIREVDVPATARVFACAFLFVAIWKHAMEPHDTERFDADAFLRNYLDIVLRGLAPERR